MMDRKELPIHKGDYPELDNLQDGAKIKIDGEGVVRWQGGEYGVIEFSYFNIETENAADKEYKKLRGEPYSNENQADSGPEDSF